MTAKKRWFFGGSLILVFFLGLYLFLIWPSQKRFNLIRLESANKVISLRSFFTRPEGPPANKERPLLNNEIKILEEKYRAIEKAFCPEREEMVMANPVEFGNILYRTKKELLEAAGKAGLKIPSDLGFKETIPSAEEVKIMAKELEVITFLIKEDIILRGGDIEGIKYLGLGMDGPWEKVSMELSLRGEFGRLIEFIYRLSQGDKIYILKSLEIKKTKEAKEEEPIRAAISLDSYRYRGGHGN